MKTAAIAGLSVAFLLVAGFSISGMVVHAAPQSSVYTEDNAASNSVLRYLAGSNGVLSPAGTFSTGGAGTGSALHSQGALALTEDEHWLLAVDAGSDQITVFQVNNDGILSSLAPVSSHGTTPISLTTYHDWVYVLDAGSANIAGFVLSNSGTLSYVTGSSEPVPGGPGSSPEQIGFSPHGNTLLVTEKNTNTIDSYSVDNSGVAGTPTPIPSNGGGPYGFAFTNNGYLILSEAGSKSASSYAVSESGGLRTVSGAIPDFAGTPCWIAVSHDGKLAYAGNGGGSIISGYAISGQGTLSLFSSVAARTTGAASLDQALSGNNQYLFSLSTGFINSYQTYPDGGLSTASSVAVPATAGGLASA